MEADSGIVLEVYRDDKRNLGGGDGVDAHESRYSGWWSGSGGSGSYGKDGDESGVFF